MSIKSNESKSTEVAAVFRELHDRYYGRVVSGMTAVVRDRDAAEDIAATAFGRAYQYRERFRGESSLYTWVYRIALNEALKCRKAKQLVSLEAIPEPVSGPPEPDRLELSARLRQLRQILNDLPAIYRRVLVDHFIHGYSTKRIAHLHRIPLGTVLSRIHKGKRLVRAALEVLK